MTDARTSAEDAYMRTHRIFVREYVRVCAVMCVLRVCDVVGVTPVAVRIVTSGLMPQMRNRMAPAARCGG